MAEKNPDQKTDKTAVAADASNSAGPAGTVATGQAAPAAPAPAPVVAEGSKAAVDAGKGLAPEDTSLAKSLKTPDGEGRKGGELVKKGSMVRPVHGVMVDSLTGVTYPQGVYTEVEQPSAWLDGQVRTKKMESR